MASVYKKKLTKYRAVKLQSRLSRAVMEISSTRQQIEVDRNPVWTTYECNKLLPQHRDVTHNENVTREDHVAQRRKQSSAQHTIETDQKHVRVRVHSVILVAVEFTVLSATNSATSAPATISLLHSSRDVLTIYPSLLRAKCTSVPYSNMDAETAH